MTECRSAKPALKFALLLLAVLLAACGVKTGKEPAVSVTLEQAKQEVWRNEDELVTRVPPEAVIKRWPRSETSKVLFECAEPGRYYWPGSAQLQIEPTTDSHAVLKAIEAEWSSRAGWHATWPEEGPEVFHLDLLRDDGLHVAIMNLESNTVLQVNSFSPCFELAAYDPNHPY